MAQELQPYLDEQAAKELGFRGSYCVLRVQGELKDEWDRIYAALISQITGLQDIAVTPIPHMTLCWIEETDRDRFLPVVNSWTTDNLPILIQNRIHLARFSDHPRLPYIAVRNSAELKNKRQHLVKLLLLNNLHPIEEQQPHLSLFYALDIQQWKLLEHQVNTVRQGLLATPITLQSNHIEVVTFDNSGRQQISRLP